MKIISGRSNPALARSLAKIIKADYIETHISHFEDHELRVQIMGDLNMSDVAIIQSTSKPANDNLMELLLLADAAKRANARKITAVIPYLGYSRQDHLSYQHSPISANLVARLIEASGVDRLVTVDLHSKQVECFFAIPVHNIPLIKCFITHLMNYKYCTVVSPDIGGAFRASRVSNLLETELIVINKFRDSNNKCYMSEIIGKVEGKNCVLIDDIIDTGGTILKAAMLLRQEGALSIDAFITHPVLSKNAEKIIQGEVINKVYVTNTIPFQPRSPKFEVVNIDHLLAQSLMQPH